MRSLAPDDFRVATQAAQYLQRRFAAAAHQQQARAVGQLEHAQQEQQAGDGNDAEHPAPVAAVAEGGVGEEGDEDADGDHQLVQRHHGTADVLGRDLRQIERRGEGGDTDRQPKHNARHDQRHGRPGEAAKQ
jgi:hypothetical protein